MKYIVTQMNVIYNNLEDARIAVEKRCEEGHLDE